MIVCFKTFDLDNFRDYIKKINARIDKNRIGIIFKSVDYEYFTLGEEAPGLIEFLVILRIEYVLPNIVPRVFLVSRILKSLRVKGNVKVIAVNPREAFNLLIEYKCGDGAE
jgi:hypothetical protein